MADGKKSFVLYCDLIHTVDLLDDILAGKLFKHLLKYVNDENPETEDLLLRVAFEPIKRQLKRDLKDWEESLAKRSDAGILGNLKRWHLRIYEQVMSGKITLEQAIEKTKHRKVSHTDNVQSPTIPIVANIADNVTVNVNDTVKRESTAPANGLGNSNLFRKPKIPTKQQVWEAVSNAGGTKEMAKAFFEKHEGTGWFINGSPIVNYVALAQKFVSTWKNIDTAKNKNEDRPTSAPLKFLNQDQDGD